MILNNSSTWINISETAIRKLNALQNSMFQKIFDTPKTTPSIALWWDLGTLPMEYRIMVNKLSLIFHILHLDDDKYLKSNIIPITQG